MNVRRDEPDEILTPEDVCAMLKININQLYKHNAMGSFPMYRVGKHCRYLRSEVLNWFMRQNPDRDPTAIGDRKLALSQLPNVRPPGRTPSDSTGQVA